MPRVQENAPGIRPSRSISRGSRISTITTSSLADALIESTALRVSISALASSIRDLIPRWMVWGMNSPFPHPEEPQSGVSKDAGPSMASWFETRFALLTMRVFLCPSFRFALTRAPERRRLPHQFLHRAFEAFDRDRVHPLREQPAQDGGGFGVIPVLLRHRIEPHRMRIGARDALDPDRAGLLVDVLDRAAGHHDLVRRHRGVADEHHLVVVRVFVQHVPGRRAIGEAPLVLLPDALVEAVVEVEILHVLEFGLGGREQLLDLLDMRIHGPTDVEEDQYLDRIAPLGAHMNVEIAVVGSLLDR